MSVRRDRLQAEYEAMKRFRSRVVKWRVIGGIKPPEVYEFDYHLKSIIEMRGNKPVYHTDFVVKVTFPSSYPADQPEVRFSGKPYPLHPNVYVGGRICIEDRWIPGIGIPLDAICEMVGKMIAFQEHNIFSRANPSREIVEWIKRSQGNRNLLPVDSSPIRLPDLADAVQWGDDVSFPPPFRIEFGD